VGLNFMAMNDANPMRFLFIFEGRLLADQIFLPFSSAPRTDNLHR
jgi:hypothetical protein